VWVVAEWCGGNTSLAPGGSAADVGGGVTSVQQQAVCTAIPDLL
jgi:hypothetical protein